MRAQTQPGETGREIIALHKEWLGFTWTEYSPEAHLGLTQMYVDDARFTAYYDQNVPGCAAFCTRLLRTGLKGKLYIRNQKVRKHLLNPFV